MKLYHDSKDGARLAGAPLADMGFEVKVEMEPDNGWVLVAVPTKIEHLAYISEDWLDWCEVDLSRLGGRLGRKPVGHKKPKPPEARKKPVPPPPPPKKGTKNV